MRNRHVEVTAMPFGLTNTPAVFMELMSQREDDHGVTEGREDDHGVTEGREEAEQRGSYLDVEGINWVMSQSWHYRKEQTIS
ncbi:hypothetical protein Tco_0263198 [Tanacetum coccineum]